MVNRRLLFDQAGFCSLGGTQERVLASWMEKLKEAKFMQHSGVQNCCPLSPFFVANPLCDEGASTGMENGSRSEEGGSGEHEETYWRSAVAQGGGERGSSAVVGRGLAISWRLACWGEGG